jgi:hypothetical protein
MRKFGEPEADVRAADEEEYFSSLISGWVAFRYSMQSTSSLSVCRRLVRSADPASIGDGSGGSHARELDTIRTEKAAPAA